MTKATKNNGTFENLNTREGARYSAKRGNVEIVATPCDNYYLATLWLYDRPMVSAEGYNATWSLGQLVKATKATAWTDENTINETVTLAKDLYDFIKRPAREKYNNRNC